MSTQQQTFWSQWQKNEQKRWIQEKTHQETQKQSEEAIQSA